MAAGPLALTRLGLGRLRAFAVFGGQLGDGSESCGIDDGEVGEDLAIDVDFRVLQVADETGVRRSVGAGRGVDAGDPEPAKIALFALSPDVRVLPGLVNHLDGDGKQP